MGCVPIIFIYSSSSIRQQLTSAGLVMEINKICSHSHPSVIVYRPFSIGHNSGLENLDNVFYRISADRTKTTLIPHDVDCTLKAHAHVPTCVEGAICRSLHANDTFQCRRFTAVLRTYCGTASRWHRGRGFPSGSSLRPGRLHRWLWCNGWFYRHRNKRRR